MPHELFIKLELDEEKVYSRTNFSVNLSITNRGKVIFPGGIFNTFAARFPSVKSDYEHIDLTAIPNINPEETITIDPIEVYAYEDGVCWIELTVTANDKEKVNLYRNDKPERSWIHPIYVYNSETKKIIELLESLLKRINGNTENGEE